MAHLAEAHLAVAHPGSGLCDPSCRTTQHRGIHACHGPSCQSPFCRGPSCRDPSCRDPSCRDPCGRHGGHRNQHDVHRNPHVHGAKTRDPYDRRSRGPWRHGRSTATLMAVLGMMPMLGYGFSHRSFRHDEAAPGSELRHDGHDRPMPIRHASFSIRQRRPSRPSFWLPSLAP